MFFESVGFVVFYLSPGITVNPLIIKETLSSYFESLEDPRSLGNQRHPLITLIGTSLLAALSGIESFSGIQDFVDMHMDELEKYFDFPHGLPSHDTYQRL